MADIAINCPQCGHQYRFADDLAGKRGRCKSCQAVFRIPELPATPPAAAAAAPAASSRPAAPSSLPRSGPAADDGKVTFNCPTCGHGYRLDAKLAGKQGRCTSCQGVFTIPATSVTTTAARSTGIRPPAASSPVAGDSDWWELDSSESVPTATAQAVAGRPRAATTAAAVAASSPRGLRPADDGAEAPVVTARPVRPKWVLYAGIGGGVVAAGIALAVVSSLVSNAPAPATPSVAEQPKDQPPTAVAVADDEDDAEEDGGKSSPAPAAPLAGVAGQHLEAITALTNAYQKIADGYARIRDADSIAEASGAVALGVADLKSAATRGKSLPPLSPSDRQALVRQAGPPLIQAVERVLAELRRLQGTPGLRSDFDRLIAAYTRTREEIRREVDRP